MRILVSGGAGFIGSHIVETCLAAGHEVAVLDDLSSGKRENVPPGATLFVVDIRKREAVRQVLGDFQPEAVSHQAAQASVSVSMRDPALDAATNVLGGANLLLEAIDAGVRRYVFASTGGAIYGEVPEGSAATESWPPRPYSPYAIHKLAHEQLVALVREEGRIAATILRYANVYGARQDPHGEAGVVAIFFERALAGKELTINALAELGDGGCTRDYVHVEDVARANVAALEGGLSESVLNVGTGRAVGTRELAERVLALTGSSSPVRHGPRRAGDLARSTLDPTRLQQALGNPLPLEVGLARTAAWYAARGA
jgi:UDP-glucose 4-epimerase